MTTDIDVLDPSPIKARLTALTPEELADWVKKWRGSGITAADGADFDYVIYDLYASPVEARLVLNAPADLAALVARVEALEAENERWRNVVAAAREAAEESAPRAVRATIGYAFYNEGWAAALHRVTAKMDAAEKPDD